MTGLASFRPDLGSKRLELLAAAAPEVRRPAVIWNPRDPDDAVELAAMQAAAPRLGLTMLPVEVQSTAEMGTASDTAVRLGADALILIAGLGAVWNLATRLRLPTVMSGPDAGRLHGALFALGADHHRDAPTRGDPRRQNSREALGPPTYGGAAHHVRSRGEPPDGAQPGSHDPAVRPVSGHGDCPVGATRRSAIWPSRGVRIAGDLLARAPAPRTGYPHGRDLSARPHSESDMDILVVDDDRDIADIIGYSLRKEGHRPILAHSGEEALALAERQRPDLVVLDVMLPGLSGFDVCRKLRERGPVPVILLTARGEEADRVWGLDLGADDYLTKPFSHRELLARIRAVAAAKLGGPDAGPGQRDGRRAGDRLRRTRGHDARRPRRPDPEGVRDPALPGAERRPGGPARAGAGVRLGQQRAGERRGPVEGPRPPPAREAGAQPERPGVPDDGARRRLQAGRPPPDVRRSTLRGLAAGGVSAGDRVRLSRRGAR